MGRSERADPRLKVCDIAEAVNETPVFQNSCTENYLNLSGMYLPYYHYRHILGINALKFAPVIHDTTTASKTYLDQLRWAEEEVSGQRSLGKRDTSVFMVESRTAQVARRFRNCKFNFSTDG